MILSLYTGWHKVWYWNDALKSLRFFSNMAGPQSNESLVLGITLKLGKTAPQEDCGTEQHCGVCFENPPHTSHLPTQAWDSSGKPKHHAYLPKHLIHCWGTSWHLEVIYSDQQRMIITAEILCRLSLDSTISQSNFLTIYHFFSSLELDRR